mmetsp:Transcript_17624/g.48747  ORF Transcript_17624/g.48747 Transcript_17624/m.48747 type:complete len:217 (-) Transcript_17624:1070-1720(-)
MDLLLVGKAVHWFLGVWETICLHLFFSFFVTPLYACPCPCPCPCAVAVTRREVLGVAVAIAVAIAAAVAAEAEAPVHSLARRTKAADAIAFRLVLQALESQLQEGISESFSFLCGVMVGAWLRYSRRWRWVHSARDRLYLVGTSQDPFLEAYSTSRSYLSYQAPSRRFQTKPRLLRRRICDSESFWSLRLFLWRLTQPLSCLSGSLRRTLECPCFW